MLNTSAFLFYVARKTYNLIERRIIKMKENTKTLLMGGACAIYPLYLIGKSICNKIEASKKKKMIGECRQTILDFKEDNIKNKSKLDVLNKKKDLTQKEEDNKIKLQNEIQTNEVYITALKDSEISLTTSYWDNRDAGKWNMMIGVSSLSVTIMLTVKNLLNW
jgi:hypothetical protein